MRYKRVPDETVQRLPVYLRGLLLSSEQGHEGISSQHLANFVGVKPWQIRKDFSYFGEFGTPGVGYNVGRLAREIKKILRLDVVHKTALVGVGNLGSAILAYSGFRVYGFDISAAFDTDPKKVGTKVNDVLVENVSNMRALASRGIRLAIMAVPREAAQDTADLLVDAGIRGILKFSPHFVVVPDRVKVITIDIAMDLARLPYYVPAGCAAK